ncbi:hypothetical protein GCM10010360_39480 [Streptomyces nogalater]
MTGHPDHVRTHQITLPAVEAAGHACLYPEAGVPWQPSALYAAPNTATGAPRRRPRSDGCTEAELGEALTDELAQVLPARRIAGVTLRAPGATGAAGTDRPRLTLRTLGAAGAGGAFTAVGPLQPVCTGLPVLAVPARRAFAALRPLRTFGARRTGRPGAAGRALHPAGAPRARRPLRAGGPGRSRAPCLARRPRGARRPGVAHTAGCSLGPRHALWAGRPLRTGRPLGTGRPLWAGRPLGIRRALRPARRLRRFFGRGVGNTPGIGSVRAVRRPGSLRGDGRGGIR